MGEGQTDGQRRGAPDWFQAITALLSIVSVILVAMGLYITQKADTATNKASLAQQRLAEQGQVTERFGRAIDQLGSGKLDLRLGGIYALERLMRDSRVDEPNIIEVLSAYVRDHTSHAKTSGSTPVRHTPDLSTDVQAALTVLGRRPDPAHHTGIDLTDAYLAGARLRNAHFNGARLAGANLSYADLRGADFTKADLAGANLSPARLFAATVTGAYLVGTDLRGAELIGVDFSRATLKGPGRGRVADFIVLHNVEGADLTGATWPSDLLVPQRWVRDAGGRLHPSIVN